MSRIVEQPTLSRRDLLSLQLVNKRLRSVTQQALRRDHQLPTPLYGAPQQRPNTVATWQQEVRWAKYAAISGRYRSVRFAVGPKNDFYLPSGDALLIRAGNGRLVHAGLFDRQSLFSEILPAGTLAQDDYILDAKRSSFANETWRLITYSHALRAARVWSCFADGTARARELPDLEILGPGAGWSAALSEDAAHCVRGVGRRAQRILLGPANLPTLELNCYEFTSPGAICPATGRVLRVGPLGSLDVYEEDALHPLFSLRLPFDGYRPVRLEVAPDGSRFAMLRPRGLLPQRFAHLQPPAFLEGRWETCEFSRSAVPVRTCYATAWQALGRESDVDFGPSRPFGWSWAEGSGWQVGPKKLISLRRYTRDMSLYPGIQDGGQLVSLLSHTSAEQLMLFSGLSDDLEHPLCVPPTRWQTRRYAARLLQANAGGLLVYFSVLEMFATFLVGPERLGPTNFGFYYVIVPLCCSTLGLWLIISRRPGLHGPTDGAASDLRTAPLRRFVAERQAVRAVASVRD